MYSDNFCIADDDDVDAVRLRFAMTSLAGERLRSRGFAAGSAAPNIDSCSCFSNSSSCDFLASLPLLDCDCAVLCLSRDASRSRAVGVATLEEPEEGRERSERSRVDVEQRGDA